MILPIYLEPQPILRQKTQGVKLEEIKDAIFQELIENMVETMRQAQGIGLAAPQVGLGKRLTVIDLKEVVSKASLANFASDVLVLINPYITKKSFKKTLMEEGCLSIPGVYGTVKRPVDIAIDYIDQHGSKQTLKSGGLLSRVIQHEIDHLDGVLFTEKVKKYSQNKKETPSYIYVK
jgi:peptide deformylase